MNKLTGTFTMECGQMYDLFVLFPIKQVADAGPMGMRLYTVAKRTDSKGAAHLMAAGLTTCKIRSVHSLDMVLTLDTRTWLMEHTKKHDPSFFRLAPMDPKQALPDGQYCFEAVSYH